jgi:hypothetical protein
MSKPTVFITYSHHDEVWKGEVVEQFNVLELPLKPCDDSEEARREVAVCLTEE